MKLKELGSILYSRRDNIQHCILYDVNTNTDLENGCSVEYAIEHYGEREVKHLEAFVNQLLITV